MDHKHLRLIINENKALQNKLNITAFFDIMGFKSQTYVFDIQFWLDLNRLDDETMFIVEDELIENFGYKGIVTSKSQNNRTHFFRVIKNNFTENEDYCLEIIKVEKSKQGNPHKNELQMTKRAFKMLCLIAKTEKSVQIYNFLLDLEKYVTEYIIYEKEYALAQLEQQKIQSQAPMIEPEQCDHIDVSMYPSFPMYAYNGTTVLYLFYLKKYNALKFGITNELSERAKRHFSTLGDKQGDVILIYVVATDHDIAVENSLRTCVLEKGWKLQNTVIEKKTQTELIDLNRTSIRGIIDLIDIFVKQHLELIKEKENSIVSKYNENIELEKIKLQSKQADVELRKLDLELKRLEFECKKYDNERNVKQKTIFNYYNKQVN